MRGVSACHDGAIETPKRIVLSLACLAKRGPPLFVKKKNGWCARPQCRWLTSPQAQSQEDLPRRKLVRRNLRAEFGDSDKVGVQDFVLLDDFKSENAFIKNLRDRFAGDLIYVSVLLIVQLADPLV